MTSLVKGTWDGGNRDWNTPHQREVYVLKKEEYLRQVRYQTGFLTLILLFMNLIYKRVFKDHVKFLGDLLPLERPP